MRMWVLMAGVILASAGTWLCATDVTIADIWVGDGDGRTWQDGLNWDTGVAPQFPGDDATFDAGFAVVANPIRLTASVVLGSLRVLGPAGHVVVADLEPSNPVASLGWSNGGAAAQILLDASAGYSLTVEESIVFTLIDDVEVQHFGSTSAVFAIRGSIFGPGRTLTFLPGTGRAQLVGSSNLLHRLSTEIQLVLGDSIPGTGDRDSFVITSELEIGVSGVVNVAAEVDSAQLMVNGRLVVGTGSDIGVTLGLIGTGQLEVHNDARLFVQGSAGLYSGSAVVSGGTLSVGGAFGGPPGQVLLLPAATIGTTSTAYNPRLDPAIVVDPSAATPGGVGLSIDVAGFGGSGVTVDTNFSNPGRNGYRLGSSTVGTIVSGTNVVPFDNLGGTSAYYFGGEGRLEINAVLNNTAQSGSPTALVMPAYVSPEAYLNPGQIVLRAFGLFQGPVRVEQGQLVLAHGGAVAAAAALDVVAPAASYNGGNFQHGTLVLDPAILGVGYSGPAPNLSGGALGFTTNHTLTALPTTTGRLGPTTFDASDFHGGASNSSLLALGGDSVITQGAGFVINDALSDTPGNPVVLVTTDRVTLQLTQVNSHSGGTAVVGRSRLRIGNSGQLGPGPLNIAGGATLELTASATISNPLDLHDATPFGRSGIDVAAGTTTVLAGRMSTAAAPQATLEKRGAGLLRFQPATPWQAAGNENSWGLRLAEGDVIIDQLPEYDPAGAPWNVGPLVLETLAGGQLTITGNTVSQATNSSNAGFRVLRAEASPLPIADTIDVAAGATLRLAGVDDRHEVYRRIVKEGDGALHLGGDSSGGHAFGSRHDARGEIDIRRGELIVGGLAGTDDAGRAFPNDVVLRLQNGTRLTKRQDLAATAQSLYVNQLAGGGTAHIGLFQSGTPLGDGSLHVEVSQYGTLSIDGRLVKEGDAPLRFSAAHGSNRHIGLGATLEINDGSVVADGTQQDPFTSSSGNSLAVVNNSSNSFRVTSSALFSLVQVHSLSGAGGRTSIDQFAFLNVKNGAAAQRYFEIDGRIQASQVVIGERLTGRGSIVGNVSVSTGAALSPGTTSAVTPTPAVGQISITGNYVQQSGSALEIEIGGYAQATQRDVLFVSGIATLDGTLKVSLVDAGGGPFVPNAGDSFLTLVASNGVVNQFVTLDLPKVANGTGLTWQVQYSPITVLLVVTSALLGDYNGDGIVDAADYTVWRNNLGSTTNFDADGSRNGVIDLADYQVWRTNFGMVAPGAGSATLAGVELAAAAVPEPSAFVIASLATLAFAAGRSRRSPARLLDAISS